jgi:hypothetical protein
MGMHKYIPCDPVEQNYDWEAEILSSVRKYPPGRYAKSIACSQELVFGLCTEADVPSPDRRSILHKAHFSRTYLLYL